MSRPRPPCPRNGRSVPQHGAKWPKGKSDVGPQSMRLRLRPRHRRRHPQRKAQSSKTRSKYQPVRGHPTLVEHPPNAISAKPAPEGEYIGEAVNVVDLAKVVTDGCFPIKAEFRVLKTNSLGWTGSFPQPLPTYRPLLRARSYPRSTWWKHCPKAYGGRQMIASSVNRYVQT
jgi:hypothetical protein